MEHLPWPGRAVSWPAQVVNPHGHVWPALKTGHPREEAVRPGFKLRAFVPRPLLLSSLFRLPSRGK